MTSERTETVPLQTLLDRTEIVEVSTASTTPSTRAIGRPSARFSWRRSRRTASHRTATGRLCVGADALVEEWRTTLGGFDATQHAVTNHAVSIAGDEAACSAHVQAKHYLPNYMGSDSWTSGCRQDYGLVRTRRGWRVRSTRLDVLWAEGNRQLFGLARRRLEEGLVDGSNSG